MNEIELFRQRSISEASAEVGAASSTWNALIFCRDILGEQPVSRGGIIFMEWSGCSTANLWRAWSVTALP